MKQQRGHPGSGVEGGMRYYLYETQTGEGCDYTIGCGLRMTPLEATTLEGAKQEVLDGFEEETENLTEDRESMTILCVTEEVDIMGLLNEIGSERRKERLAKEREQTDAAEKELLAKLLKKHGRP